MKVSLSTLIFIILLIFAEGVFAGVFAYYTHPNAIIIFTLFFGCFNGWLYYRHVKNNRST